MIAPLRLLGIVGGATAALAVMAPAVTIATDGTHTLFAITPVISGLLALAAALGGFYAWHGAARGQLACSLAGLLFSALGIYRTLIEIGLKSDQVEAQLREVAKAANFPDVSPPMNMIMMGTRLEWGLYLTFGGLLVCLVSAVVSLLARRD